MAENGTTQAAAEWVGIDVLAAWDDNPRDNDEAAIEVAKSIERFGWGAPIVARAEDRMVIAGHTRLKAARMLGLERVPVRFLDLDPVDARLLALADNKVGELAGWSDDLSGVMKALASEGADLLGLGFDDEELLALLAEECVPVDDEDDDFVPELEQESDSEPGKVYELGPHRLLCGDSTEAASWELLMADHDGAHAVWTDPPYGIAYVGKTGDALTIENDRLNDGALNELLRTSLSNAIEASRPGTPFYVAAPSSGKVSMVFATVLMDLGLYRQRLIWVKDRFVLGHSDYHYRHEDIYFGYSDGDGRKGRGDQNKETMRWHGDNAQDSVLEFKKPNASREHPTMKPIELICYCLENSTGAGMTVIDPFGGSGSTLIAAATIGRECRTIELDPRYCDVIRRRWTRWAQKWNRPVGSGGLE